MKRSNFTFFKIRNLTVFLVFLSLVSANSSVALNFQYEEDFTDNTALGWEFWAGDWTAYHNGGIVTEMEHSMVVENHQLYSNIEPSSSQIDYAYYPLFQTYRVWSMDIYQNDPGTWGFWLKINEVNWTGVSHETIELDYLLFAIKQDRIDLIGPNDREGLRIDRLIDMNASNMDLNTVGRIHHFDFIRTPTFFQIYLDNTQLVNYQSSFDEYSEFNYFGVMASVAMRFDNFRATSDYDGVLDQILSNDEESIIERNTPLLIGIGSLAVLGTVLTIFKKKS